jgi:hypothetical protein
MFSIQGFLTCSRSCPMNYKNLSQIERHQIHSLMKAQYVVPPEVMLHVRAKMKALLMIS